MEKYWEEDMKSFYNCYNAVEININLPNLFSSKFWLSLSNHHINNHKDCEDFAEENKQNDSIDRQHEIIQHNNNVTSWSELEKIRLILSFHQADLTEIQVINKNIKGLNRRTIYRTFKVINKTKGFKKDLYQEEKVVYVSQLSK